MKNYMIPKQNYMFFVNRYTFIKLMNFYNGILLIISEFYAL